MKKLIRVLSFFVILAVCLTCAYNRFGYMDNLGTQEVFKGFYQLNNNSVEVVCTGTSAVQRGWVSPYAFKKYGIASYNMATASQPFCLTKSIMQEVLKTQSPKVFVIDIRGAIDKPDQLKDEYIRRVTDNMKESPVRWNAIGTALEFADKAQEKIIDTSDISYYLKIVKYHDLYNSKKRPKRMPVEYYDGFAYYEPSMFNLVPQDDVGVIKDRMALDGEAEKALGNLLDYCDSIDAEVIFSLIPFAGSADEMKQLNTAMDIVEARGYKCLNCLDKKHREELNIDFDKFFYNKRHTNYYGSTIYTDYICRILSKDYGISDARKDGRHDSWKINADVLQSKTEKLFKEMKQKIAEM